MEREIVTMNTVNVRVKVMKRRDMTIYDNGDYDREADDV